MRQHTFIEALARQLRAANTTADAVAAVGTFRVDKRWRWLGPLAQRYAAAVQGHPRPSLLDVLQFLWTDAGLGRARSKYPLDGPVERWVLNPQEMHPAAAAAGWDIPAIGCAGDLAGWLGVEPGELEWFADLKGLGYRRAAGPLRHYHYRLLTKRYGNIRLTEAPKPRLKVLQRQVLRGILERIPLHPAAHGFVKGRSIKTFVAPHVGQRVVLKMDLQNFFPSIGITRIESLFRTLGYPEAVAGRLAGICTSSSPRDVWKQADFEVDRAMLREARALYSRRHLPQGAPTSPALANACLYRADCRLAGLAESAGAVYSRYADDLAFSGGEAFDRSVERFSTHVAVILDEEGFAIHHRKTRIMRRGVRQRLAGIVANAHLNIRRDDFDRLKAILTNCARRGPASQNREAHPNFRAHLDGRVAFVEMINPGRGQRLRAIFDRVEWP